MTGWKAVGGANQWVVKDGILTSPKSALTSSPIRSLKILNCT
nr:hypothetical protein [Niabella hibiscisoli]